MDFRRNPPALPPLTIMNSTVTAVESFRFLGTTISQDLKWDNHIDSIVRKAQQRLYFLRQLRKFNLPQELLKQFYSAIIESVLCTSITVWFSSATKSDLRRLRRVVRTAEQARAEWGGLLVLEHLPLFPLMPKVPFCQGNFFLFFFVIKRPFVKACPV